MLLSPRGFEDLGGHQFKHHTHQENDSGRALKGTARREAQAAGARAEKVPQVRRHHRRVAAQSHRKNHEEGIAQTALGRTRPGNDLGAAMSGSDGPGLRDGLGLSLGLRSRRRARCAGETARSTADRRTSRQPHRSVRFRGRAASSSADRCNLRWPADRGRR